MPGVFQLTSEYVRDLALSLRGGLSCCARWVIKMHDGEGIRYTRNMNSRLSELDHLHLTFGRVKAALLTVR
jgi:hypothetical protein